ncbi:hypothetical protein [Streptomyces flaveolus]|uniref:hypothetical protein n=1 Tax=Streptomyces flaveolus TaxID=67297 RepID=UPI0033EC898D
MWAEDLARQLDRSVAADAAHLARIMAGSLEARPLFCDLLGHAAVSLERQVPTACVHAYKLASLDAVSLLADAFHRAMPQFSPEAGRDLVASATALAAVFWQYAHSPRRVPCRAVRGGPASRSCPRRLRRRVGLGPDRVVSQGR